MPAYTENYNLTKPHEDENYDVNVFNSNADIIDGELVKCARGKGLKFSVVEGILNVTYDDGK